MYIDPAPETKIGRMRGIIYALLAEVTRPVQKHWIARGQGGFAKFSNGSR